MKIGTFQVKSGKIIVSDPCYDHKSEAKYPAVNGVWQASVAGKDGVASLTASTKGASKFRWEKDTTAGVDSGQMSIFDLKFYRDDNLAKGIKMPDWMTPSRIKKEGKGEKFYGACCTLTLSENSAGVLPNGVASGTLHGDGVYPVYIKKNEQGKVVAVKVRF